MEFEDSNVSSAGFHDDSSNSSTGGDRGAGPTRNHGISPTAFADKPGDALDEITLSAAESEGWVQPSSISCLASQTGAPGPANAQASGEFVSLSSQSNSSSKVIPLQQGQGTGPTMDSSAASEDVTDDVASSFTIINALKREVFATSALLRAVRMHALSQTRGLSAASQQQLAAAVAPLVKSFELLNERLAAAEAAKEPPPAELQEQHIHPFLFVLAQQQLQHKQQQGLNKQQQLLHQSCMRALASAVLRFLSLRNCALQATQRLHSAPTQPSAANATAAAAAVLGSEAYGGTYFAPASPAAEEELLLLQCLDLLSSSLLGPAGHVFSDACVASTIQCCVAVSLLHRASPLLRNAAASRAVAITRHLFASESLISLSRRQGQLHDIDGSQQQRAATDDQHQEKQEEHHQQQQQQQHASSPPRFIARLESAMSLRSTDTLYSPTRHSSLKGYGLECRLRILALVARLLSHEEHRGTPHSSGSSSNSNSNSIGYTGVGSVGNRADTTLPPFVSVADAHTAPEGSGDTKVDASGRQNRPEESMHASDTSAPPAAATPAAAGSQHIQGLSVGERGSRLGPFSGIDREFEGLLGHHGKDKAANMEARLLCLRLLCVALEAGRDTFSLFPKLLQPLQTQILPLVLQQDTRSAPLMLLSLTLRVVGDFIAFLRPYIKDEIERCLYQLLRLSTTNHGGPSKTLAAEAQEVALDMLRELCSDASFGFELMLNYDSDIRRSNVFGVLVTLLLQLAAPRVPSLRGAYRFAECDIEGGQGHPWLSGTSLSHAAVGVAATASEASTAKTPTQQQSPSGSSPSSVSTTAAAESSKSHHHGAFHLRRAPPRSPLKASRSSADANAAVAMENWATDAAGVTRPAGLSNVNRLALAAVLRLISSLASLCDSMKHTSTVEQQQRQEAKELHIDKPQFDRESAAAYFLRVQEMQPISQRRKHKALLSYGATVFNSNTKEAISQLEGLGLLPTPATPRSTALFLKETGGLDLRAVGLYLSANKPWNAQVLREFVSLFKFTGVGLVAALRNFLKTFRLPGESQQIERVMEAFADEFFRQQPLVSCPHNREKLAAANAGSGTATTTATAATTTATESPASAEAKPTTRPAAAAEPLELSLWRWVADEGFYCSSRVAAAREGSVDKEQQISSDELAQQLSEFTPVSRRPLSIPITNAVSTYTALSNGEGITTGLTPKLVLELLFDLAVPVPAWLTVFAFTLAKVLIYLAQPAPGYVLMMHKDTVFVLSYSIIMLNTDQHNSQVRSKMRVEDFVKNNRGINNGSDLPAFFLQNIYVSIRHQEIKLKEAPLTSSPPPAAQGQKADAASIEQQQQPVPDIFDVLADGWTPPEGAGLGWGAFASPYNGPKNAVASEGPGGYRVVLKPRASRVAESSGIRNSAACAITADDRDVEGLEMEMFRILWNGGSLAVLRGAFEASLDLRHLEEILCGVLSLARAATVLGQVVALNTIVAELCSYFVYSVPAHSQLVLAPIMYLIRQSGASLREEGWGAILELLLRLHALDLLPPALMGLDDFEGSGGAALPSLCTLAPPPFAPPASRRDRGAGKKGGGWLGDLTSILFALGDSDDESDGDDSSGAQGHMLSEELNFACDGLYVLRASTDFTLLPSTVAVAAAGCSEVETERDASEALHVQRVPPTQKGPAGPSGVVGPERKLPKGPNEPQQPVQQHEVPGSGSPSASPEDEEAAAARAPYLRLKTVLSHGIHIDLAVAEIFRQVEPVSSLSTAVILLVHIVLGFPPIRQNPGASPDCPLQAQPFQQQQQPSSDAAALQSRSAGEPVTRGVGGSSNTSASVASGQSSSGAHHQGPPPLQPPEDLGLPSLPGTELSMLSSYLVDAQRRGLEDDGSRRSNSVSSSVSSSAVSTPVGANAPSTQCPGISSYTLPPPVWSPLRAGTSPQLMTYRAYTDRLFCLELLGALMLSELTPGSLSLRPSKAYGTALLQNCPWLLCAVYLDTFLRRYSIGTAAGGVPNPLEVVGLAGPTQLRQQQQQREEAVEGTSANRPPWAVAILDACSKDPLAQATVKNVCNVFQSVGSRRLVDTPTSGSLSVTTAFDSHWAICYFYGFMCFCLLDLWVLHAALPHWELLFIERLVVTVLRICLRLLSDEDSLLLPVYTKAGTPELGTPNTSGCTPACQVAIHLLQLLTLLHPNIFCMHVQRICQSATVSFPFDGMISSSAAALDHDSGRIVILVSRLNLRACSSPLLIQVLLALYQRLVPLPAFLPTAPLPQHLTQQQPQQQLALRIVASLSEWIRDPEALALLVLQHRNHYQMLLQTLMAVCIYVPPSPSVQTLCPTSGERRIEGEAQDSQQPLPSVNSASSYEANCTSLALLASLIPSVGGALKSKGAAVAACLAAAANSVATANGEDSSKWKARLDCQAMWLQTMQVLAIVCSFSARPVKVKALATGSPCLVIGGGGVCCCFEPLQVLQQMLIRCSKKEPSSEENSSVLVNNRTVNAEGASDMPDSSASTSAAPAASAAATAADYWDTAPEDAYTWRLCLQLVVFPLLSLRFDYPYTPLPPGDAPPPPPQQHQQQANGHSAGDSIYAFTAGQDQEKQPRDHHFGMPWMSLPTRRRLTPEVAIGSLGLDEVYQRKAAAASLACRLFLTKMELLLQPFKVRGIYVDFVAQPPLSEDSSKQQGFSGDHPGGIEGLLPPLTQLVQLLVTEAKQAPVIYRDAFLESLKNTLLVVLTCPFVAASPIPADLKTRISPTSVLPVIFFPKQQHQQQQQQQQQQEHPNSPKGETQRPPSVEEAAQVTAKQEALLGTLSCLTDSQRLVVSAVSPFVVSTFPTVIQELLLILPTPQPPPPPPRQEQVACKEREENAAAEGAEVLADCSPGGSRHESDNGKDEVVAAESLEEVSSYSSAVVLPPADGNACAS
ncbi:sec7 domain-containing protein, putative [Eimeria mitis]|uniref:Sec7 domain-containing protein, putative n=1 Tax=Eimeria mitis TaxID=44415 RepID=U6JQC6_9EIME|nr:sec7 domain-containing protein, putative [Eimeria mitis]CDJ27700.1 sec7 domain-containing protein, putative [Eimeria mitis]